jgi:hypothetical protein
MRLESIGLFIITTILFEISLKMADMQYLTPRSDFFFKANDHFLPPSKITFTKQITKNLN